MKIKRKLFKDYINKTENLFREYFLEHNFYDNTNKFIKEKIIKIYKYNKFYVYNNDLFIIIGKVELLDKNNKLFIMIGCIKTELNEIINQSKCLKIEKIALFKNELLKYQKLELY